MSEKKKTFDIMNGTMGSYVELKNIVLDENFFGKELNETSAPLKVGEPRQIVASFSKL